MTGPRIPTVQAHRRRARHLLPFLLAIVASPLACTNDQPTAPAIPGSGPSAASTRPLPHLTSKAGQPAAGSRAMRAALSRAPLSMAAAVLPPGSGPKVLILSDVDGPSTTALANGIVSAGFHVGVKRAPEYDWFGSNPSLDGYDVVIHLNGYTYNLPLSTTAQSELKTFVSNGGGFVGTQWNGYEEGSGQQTEMSDLVLLGWNTEDGDVCEQCEVTYNTVPGQESHPVLAGLPSSFTIFADAHDASSKLTNDPSTVVLMRVPGGGAAVLASQLGSGKVVNFSFAANYAELQVNRHSLEDAKIQQLYINAVRWLSGSAGIQGGGTLDSDADGILDGTDNCINLENPSQQDTDGDGLGNACDPDDDADGVLDDTDNCPLVTNADQADADGDGVGDACDGVQVLEQTILFEPLSDKTFGNLAFGVSASTSSGLPVNFVVGGACTITASTITLTAAGTCTVTARQPGNTVYASAPDVVRSFNIAKAPAVLTVGTGFTYDGTVKQATVTTSPAGLSGVIVTYTLAGSLVSPPVDAGVYQVLAVLDNPNYEAQPAPGTLTIHPAVSVINWTSPAPITAGTPLDATQLNATASGIGGASLTGSFVYLPAPGTVLTAGENRPISVEFIPGSANYTRAIKTVTITVLVAPVPPPVTPPSRLVFRGFFRPVHNLPKVNRVKPGNAIPVRFVVETMGANNRRRSDVLKAGSPTSVPVACGTNATEVSVDETLPLGTSRLWSRGNSFTYIWKTSSTWAGTCRKLVVTLVDGSHHEALFRFVSKPGRQTTSHDDRDHRNDRDDRGKHDSRDDHDSSGKHNSGKGNDSRSRK